MEEAFVPVSPVDQSSSAITVLEICIFKAWIFWGLAIACILFCLSSVGRDRVVYYQSKPCARPNVASQDVRVLARR